jgi:hypothetical protein
LQNRFDKKRPLIFPELEEELANRWASTWNQTHFARPGYRYFFPD